MLRLLAFVLVLAIVAVLCYRFTHDQVSIRRHRKFTEEEYYRQQGLLLRVERLCSEYADTQPELSFIIRNEIINSYKDKELS